MDRRHFNALLAMACGFWVCSTSTAADHRKNPALLVLGDSLSAEYGLRRGSGWVALLEQRLVQNGHKLAVINASVSGDTTSGGRSRLPPLLQQHNPSIVVIELGANDALRGLPLSMTRDNLLAMVKAAKGMHAKVLLVGMQIPPNYGTRYAADFQNIYQELARTEKTAFVPFFLHGIADAPHAMQLFQSDRIHPNESAHPIMLDNVWAELRKLLPGR